MNSTQKTLDLELRSIKLSRAEVEEEQKAENNVKLSLLASWVAILKVWVDDNYTLRLSKTMNKIFFSHPSSKKKLQIVKKYFFR